MSGRGRSGTRRRITPQAEHDGWCSHAPYPYSSQSPGLLEQGCSWLALEMYSVMEAPGQEQVEQGDRVPAEPLDKLKRFIDENIKANEERLG